MKNEQSAVAHAAPAIWRPDVTVATIVEREGRFLFVEERVGGVAVLNQPAGHLESGETLVQAAIRETLEETGWDIELAHLIGVFQWTSPRDGRGFLRVAFAACPVQERLNHCLDEGIVRTHWLTREELLAHSVPARSPLVLAALDAHLRGTRLALDALHWVNS